jgi:Icc-related predicted phosphoesterase
MSKIRLHIASDLHDNVYRMRHHHSRPMYRMPQCDAVVFAGDMSEGMDSVSKLKLHYPNTPTFWVPGNHEFYKHNLQNLRTDFQTSSMNCLDDASYVLRKHGRQVRVLGATLWTDYKVHPQQAPLAEMYALRGMNDHREISYTGGLSGNTERMLHPMDCVKMFEASVKFIDLTLSESFDGPRVVVTHHLPSAESLDPRYYNSGLDPAFASDLNWLIEKHQPDIWVHGHTHHSRDYHIGKTRVICNPRGYDWGHGAENPNWDSNFTVEI